MISRKRVLVGLVLAISVAVPNFGAAAENGSGAAEGGRLSASLARSSPAALTRTLASTEANVAALAAGLVGAWGFDEGSGSTVADASGSGNTGTIAGATWSAAGKFGGTLVFNGSNARVNVPDSASLHLTNAMTLEAWVYPAATSSAWRDVIYKANDNYYLEGSSDNGGRPAGGGTFGSANGNVFGAAALPANAWSHLALTYDGAALRLYVNGTLVSTQARTGALATSSNPLQIGGDTIWGQYFNGRIDEVRVYNTALSAAAIQTDMNTPIGSGGGGDTTAPSTPGGLATSAVGETSITLSWNAASDNVAVTGYRMYLDGNEVNTSPSTSYVFNGLSCDHAYTLGVAAFDAAGNQSTTATIGAQTSACSDTTPPSAPGTLTATAGGPGAIALAWGAASDNIAVAGYQVFRCQGSGCGSFTQVATPTGTTYNDSGLTSGTSYSYRVRARDAAGNTGAYSNTASATTQSGPSGLVAAYGFDEGSGSTVADASGSGNTGTIAGATWSAAGKYGGALSFSGSSARVNVPDSASLHLTSGMTLEAWVNPAVSSSAWRDVIYKGDDNYYLEASSASGGSPAGGGTFGGSNGTVFGAGGLPANVWSHVALTYDGATLRLYVNGTLVGTQAKTGAIATSSNQLQVGGDSIYGQYFNGLIDEVRIYNGALSASQIAADMNSGLGVPSAPTNLTASVVSSSQIDLSWGASNSTAGIAGYRVERCQGTGCANFAQVASPNTTTYSDTGLSAATSYTYRVRAIDAVGKLGPYSNTATGFTGLIVTPRQVALTPGQTQQFAASAPGGQGVTVTWSVDGVNGGSTSVGTVTAGGLYTAPSSAGTHTVTATAQSQSGGATAYTTDYAGMFTHHNDNMRTGQNLNETVLTPANVNSASFGKLFSRPLDGVAYAAPLYVENVSIPSQGTHNVVYVATEHDSVYAFDADGLSTTPLWKDSFINPANGVTTVPAGDTGECCDIQPEIGITSTPVIDRNTNTMYVVAKTKEVSGGTTNYVQRLHALDLATGAEKLGGPVVIQATVPGTGLGSTNGQLPFNALRENQRTALLLLNGVIYFGFASHGDNQPYHGWIFGYNATTLQRTLALCLTPNQEGAGVWMSGGGLAADSNGFIYYITGDGEFDGNTGGSNWGDSYIKMTAAGVVADYFTPFNQNLLNQGNHDLGSGGALLLPDQPGAHPHEMVSSGKDGTIYLVDRDNMGHYSTSTNNIVQTLSNIFPNGTPEPGNFTAPVYFNGYVFFGPLADNLQAFKLTNGVLSTSATFRSSATFPDRGASMAVSASGTSNGILWAVQRNGVSSPGVLYAFDPTNSSNGILKALYDSSQAGSRDTLDIAAKFNPPTIANGKVYVAGLTALTVYGLLP